MHTTSLLERMRGLLGRRPLLQDQGLLLRPCAAVHTCGMRYPIDLLFLDSDWRVTKMVAALKPFRLAWSFDASMAIEMRSGTLERLNLTRGTRLYWENNSCM